MNKFYLSAFLLLGCLHVTDACAPCDAAPFLAQNASTPQYDPSVQQYIDAHTYLAVESMRMYGIPASIKLAQGILESRYGTSELATKANNHFGLKAQEGDWMGETYYVESKEQLPNGDVVMRPAVFRSYPTAADSYRDHSNHIATKSNYRRLFQGNTLDYVFWAKELRQAGYATDLSYPEKLIKVIETYKLYEIDQAYAKDSNLPTAVFAPQTPNKTQLVVTDLNLHESLKIQEARIARLESDLAVQKQERQNLEAELKREQTLNRERVAVVEEQILILDQRMAETHQRIDEVEANTAKLEAQQQLIYKSDPFAEHFETNGEPKTPRFFKPMMPNKEGIFFKSGKRAVALSAGGNLQQIALHYQVDYQKLLKYNDLENEQVSLPEGFYVFLEPKAYTHQELGEQAVHQVKKHETMHHIAQFYGVQLDRLMSRNYMKIGEEPANGEYIFINRKADKKPALRDPSEGFLGAGDFGSGGRR